MDNKQRNARNQKRAVPQDSPCIADSVIRMTPAGSFPVIGTRQMRMLALTVRQRD